MKLDPRITASLESLRRRIRRYVWFHGLAAVAACVGAAFWLSLVVDWFFEPASGVRVAFLLAGLGFLAAVAVDRLVRPLRARLTDQSMAMLYERRFPELNDALLTAVSLGPAVDRADGLEREMLHRTCREASERIGAVRAAEVMNPAPLRRGLAAAGLLAASVVGFGLLAPSGFGVWARRNLLLADELWPRRTELAVEGFVDGVRKVARGADIEIIATADLAKPLVPKTVEVRYRTGAGARGRAVMNREGEAVPGRERYQQYSHTFRGVLSPIDFELVGGDDRVGPLRVEVVESPKIESLELWCEYPDYMARTTRRIPVIGPMRIPRFTRVAVEGRANKRLIRIRIDAATEDQSSRPVVLEPSGDVAGGRGFRYTLGKLDGDAALSLTLRDADQIESAEPTRLVLVAAADEPPELAVTLSGIGTAITPRARLPIIGQARDDFGIADVWFETVVDQGRPTRKAVAAPSGNLTELAVDDALEVRDLGLAPGQKMTVALKASDRCNLQPAPNVGESPRWQLEVVTPERLRAMLQARELTLRYRYEQIIQEVGETRDSLARISLDGAAAPAKDDAKPKKDQPEEDRAAEPGDAPRDWSGREPGEEPEGDAGRASDEEGSRRLAVASLRCERAIQNSRKNANETLGTAEAFDDLRQQLINNRIDTEELKIRLQSGIADPLRAIGERMFPELERRLIALRDGLDGNRSGGQARRDAACEQIDAILTAMNRVLSRMMELEDFNEAITILQDIIREQEKLEKQARERQKRLLDELLEEK